MPPVTTPTARRIERVRAYFDAARLRRTRFAPATLEPFLSELRPTYTEYVQRVSSPGMAASLETSAFLLFLARTLKAQRVLDLGSGFSSFVLRSSGAATVVSVDDSAEWLERTREFLDSTGTRGGELMTWADFSRREWEPFDVVLHDLAGGDLRNEVMPKAIALARTACVVDDTHHDGHRAAMKRSANGHALYSLRQWTYDGFGRFAYLCVKRSAPGT